MAPFSFEAEVFDPAHLAERIGARWLTPNALQREGATVSLSVSPSVGGVRIMLAATWQWPWRWRAAERLHCDVLRALRAADARGVDEVSRQELSRVDG